MVRANTIKLTPPKGTQEPAWELAVLSAIVLDISY